MKSWLSVVVGLTLLGTARAEIPPALAKINHILVIFEENRSFDSMYGTFPGADGIANAGAAATQLDRAGHPYATLPQPYASDHRPPGPDARFPANLANRPFPIGGYVPMADKTGDIYHEFYREQLQINDGKMDRFVAYSNAAGLVMGYYDGTGTHGWKLAEEFALGDRMFHSAFGGSFLNHSYLVCSCAFRWPNAPAEIIVHGAQPEGTREGQVTPDGYAINTSRSVYLHAPRDTNIPYLVPPQTMPHIGDRLDAKGIDWAWYSGGYDDAMAGKPHRWFRFHHQPMAYFQNLAPGTPGQKAHLKDATDLMAAIDAGTLPAVAFYKPIGPLDQHPGYANVSDGDNHLGEIIARLRKSPNWADTLVIVTYDEHGGSWDHVAPPRRDRWGPGTRVPLLAIGKMVKKGFIDHTVYDFGSILRTITLRFGAEPVNQVDGVATPMINLLEP